MDILLAHGYFIAHDPHEQAVMKPYPPLGILYLSSYLKRAGFHVGVFDSTFATVRDFAVVLERERPAVVGLYVNLMTKFNVLKMIGMAKAVGARVVLGGPEPPHYAAEYLHAGADVVVRGEGEAALEALLPHLARYGLNGLEAVLGIAYRVGDGRVCETAPRPALADLSAHPWPDREAIRIEQYLDTWKTHHGASAISVIHARGCPYTCTWCSHSVYGSTHRRRTPEDAADELAFLVERYQPDRVWYADDVFAINHRWLYAYHAAQKQRGVRLPFECISRADRLNADVIATLADMGCYRLWNGSESGAQRVLDAMNRRVDAADVREKTHMLQAAGIETGMFIMLGYDGETLADLRETVAHLKTANPDVFLTTVAYPIKGTPYYAQVEPRLRAERPWAERSDRDLIVGGRHSARFYRAATRWMVSEVALHRARTRGGATRRRRLKWWLSARLGQVGMAVFARGREARGLPLAAASTTAHD
jgi:radical SAM superfamily enzyme YgiQ (UPF0313 family)